MSHHHLFNDNDYLIGHFKTLIYQNITTLNKKKQKAPAHENEKLRRRHHHHHHPLKTMTFRDNPIIFLGLPLFLLIFFISPGSYSADCGGNIPSTLDGPFAPVTVLLDTTLRGKAIDLPDTDPRVRRHVTGFEPEQISLSLSSDHDSIWVSWITG